MSKCIICGEASRNIININGKARDFDLCEYCAPEIPMGIIRLARKTTKEVVLKGEHTHWPDDEGFTFTQDNWRLFSKVVKRRKELGRPSILRSPAFSPGLKGSLYTLIASCPAQLLYTVRTEGGHILKLNVAVPSFFTFVDSEVPQESENKIVDPHAGMIQNPITGEWSWF